MGRRPIGGIFSVGLEEAYRWKDSVQSEPEIQLWVAEGTANGMRPWVTKFSGVLYDRRWLPTVERIYQWHARHERYLRNEMPLARVALLHSEQTATFHPGVAPGDRAGDHVLGMYHALVEARVPFEIVHEAFLTPDRLDQFKLLILADAAALSDAQCAAIRAFVDRGGSVLATFATSLYDELGVSARRLRARGSVRRVVRRHDRRADAELVSEPGCGSGERDSAMPILDGLDDTPRIINGVFRVQVTPTQGVPVADDADPDVSRSADGGRLPARARTDSRELYLRDLGRSRVVYIPWDIDRTFWEVMSVDHGRLLRNAVAWAANEAPPVEVTGPGLLDVTVVAAARVDDRAPRQPHQPDDDERAAARGDSGRALSGSRIRLPAGHAREEGAVVDGGDLAAGGRGGRRADGDGAVSRRSRGHRD